MDRVNKNGEVLPPTSSKLRGELAKRIFQELDSGSISNDRRDALYDKLVTISTFKAKGRGPRGPNKKGKKVKSPKETSSGANWGKIIGGG